MKYAENNRISHRQLYRQIILSFLPVFLICLPGRQGLQGVPGVLGIVLAEVLLMVYVFFLMRNMHVYADPIKVVGKVGGVLLGLFFIVYLILSGVYLLTLLGEIIPVWLLSGISKKWIAFFAAAVCCYGMERGMQRRGRIAEVSGGIFLVGILIMLLLCVGQCRAEYFAGMVAAGTMDGKKLLQNMYKTLCAFSGIGLLPFVMKNTEKKGSAGKTAVWALLTVGGILSAVLLILPVVLGWNRFVNEKTPILPLLAGADLPGNVLARFDVLWMGFLLFGLFFALGSVFYYGSQILDSVHLGSGKYWLPAVAYVMFVICLGRYKIEAMYEAYLGYIFVPGLILIQIWMFLRGKQKRRKKAAVGSLMIIAVLFFTGCAGIEPEKRMYPLALGIDFSGESYKLTYGMPDLPQATGQGKDEEENTPSMLTIQGKDFQEIQEIYERSQEKYLDIGHLQVIIIGENLLNSEKWKEFLMYLKEEPLVGENIYLFCAEDPEAVMNWDSGGTSVGEYLTGLLENKSADRQKNGVTLRQIYYQWYQNGTMKEMPQIILGENGLQVFYLNDTDPLME